MHGDVQHYSDTNANKIRKRVSHIVSPTNLIQPVFNKLSLVSLLLKYMFQTSKNINLAHQINWMCLNVLIFDVIPYC